MRFTWQALNLHVLPNHHGRKVYSGLFWNSVRNLQIIFPFLIHSQCQPYYLQIWSSSIVRIVECPCHDVLYRCVHINGQMSAQNEDWVYPFKKEEKVTYLIFSIMGMRGSVEIVIKWMFFLYIYRKKRVITYTKFARTACACILRYNM